jgi:hypothetical protein
MNYSEAGYFEFELESLLHVGIRAAVIKLLKDNRIYRQKVCGRYLYCSSRMTKRKHQCSERKKQQAIADLALEPMSSEVLFQEGKTLVELFVSLLDEKQRRLYAGLESIKLGHRGDKKISQLFGLDAHTAAKGRQELWSGKIETDRGRRVAGGARCWKKTPQIIAMIEALMQYETAGDPMTGLKWTRKTAQKLTNELKALGIKEANRTSVGRLLKELGYSLRFNHKKKPQVPKKTPEARAQRNQQFEYINAVRRQFAAEGNPAIIADSKKKGMVGMESGC